MDDERIIQLFFERQEEGLIAAMEKYRSACYALAFRLLGNEEDAEECVNDAFLEAWNGIPPQQPESLPAFLKTVVHRRAIDILRTRNAQRRGGGTEELPFDELENLFSSKDDPAGEMEKQLLTETIKSFVEELEPVYKNLFIARYWYAASIDSLCKQFGWGSSRVKSALRRLRERLRKKLKEENLI